jgi:hypothetical protein
VFSSLNLSGGYENGIMIQFVGTTLPVGESGRLRMSASDSYLEIDDEI